MSAMRRMRAILSSFGRDSISVRFEVLCQLTDFH